MRQLVLVLVLVWHLHTSAFEPFLLDTPPRSHLKKAHTSAASFWCPFPHCRALQGGGWNSQDRMPYCLQHQVAVVVVCRKCETVRVEVQKGESLDVWATHVRPSFIAIWQVLADLMQLLAAMHAANIVHRDLKPANVLWRSRVHEWTLIDFGCASETGARPSPHHLSACFLLQMCFL
jgi:hypothetical protein